MEDSRTGDKQVSVKNMKLVNHARRLTHAIKTDRGMESTLMLVQDPQSQEAVCAALTDSYTAIQSALTANNCPGV